MVKVKNPILPGFNPDPSIIRVEDDYYIATSTFEWFPGVQIHHSKDLIHWTLIKRPLDRLSQLNMSGNVDSGGIWAPNLSWHAGTFYLVYTDMKQWKGPYKVLYNYLVTASNIMGPWSDPVFLNSSGFDPSLFHDDDGRKWVLNQFWDYRQQPRRACFAGIIIQEYDHEKQKLKGPVHNIFKGTELGATEGPNLYKYNGFYYLITAEGGTEYTHAATLARSKDITGPYELSPYNPLITSLDNPELTLQKAGHASIADSPAGELYLVHLCGRPVGKDRRCILGRETAIQKCVFTDDNWIKLADNQHNPLNEIDIDSTMKYTAEHVSLHDDFDKTELDINFQTLRMPAEENWLSLNERPGFLRLYGRESLTSRHEQSLVARRVQAFHCQATTSVEFNPDSVLQMAGLTAFYNAGTHYNLFISINDSGNKILNILFCDHELIEWPLKESIEIPDLDRVYLRAEINYEILQYYYSSDNEIWMAIGPEFEAAKLSDEYANGFTGAFFGISVQDFTGKKLHADFDWFEYEEFSD